MEPRECLAYEMRLFLHGGTFKEFQIQTLNQGDVAMNIRTGHILFADQKVACREDERGDMNFHNASFHLVLFMLQPMNSPTIRRCWYCTREIIDIHTRELLIRRQFPRILN